MVRHRACDDFHRSSEAVRRDFLGGAGLTRRQVFGAGLGAGLALYGAKAMPLTRVFEAAGAGACLVTDAWTGLELFLREGDEVLVARDGADVAEHLAALTPARARAMATRPARRTAGR